MATIKIDAQAFEWLNRNAGKRAKMLTELPANEQAKIKREVDHWKALSTKIRKKECKMGTDNFLEIILNRQDVRSIQNLIVDSLITLNSKTIPAYKERLRKQPEVIDYLKRCEALYIGLTELLETLKRVA